MFSSRAQDHHLCDIQRSDNYQSFTRICIVVRRTRNYNHLFSSERKQSVVMWKAELIHAGSSRAPIHSSCGADAAQTSVELARAVIQQKPTKTFLGLD